jgi:hypothetical protein
MMIVFLFAGLAAFRLLTDAQLPRCAIPATCRIFARFPRCLSWSTDERLILRLGYESND